MGAPDVDPEIRVDACQRAFRRHLGFPRRLGYLFVGLMAFLLAALLGRLGSDVARGGAAIGLISVFAGLATSRRYLGRKWKEPGSAIYHCLRRIDEAQASRASRAFRTWKRLNAQSPTDGVGGESKELARLHVSRVLDGVALETVEKSGRKLRAKLMRWVASVALACLTIILLRPLSIVEGVDVLLARNGVGLYSVAYVAEIAVTAELPTYLDGSGKKHIVSAELATVPQGSQVEIRVVPLVTDRKLLLTDGVKEVPLVSDGQGALVARWTAENHSALRIAARFGQVLLLDGHETMLAPLEDRAPIVTLVGAPAEHRLENLEELELSFVAGDDHGLTQVELVVASGQRSERTELAHFDGQKLMYQGAHRLTREHELLRRAFLPVHISIEAKDGNTATGPSWGKSKKIILLPEPLGKETAARYQALRAFRGALTSYLASEVAAAHLSMFEAQEERTKAHGKLVQAFTVLREALGSSLERSRKSLAFLEAQVEALSRKGAQRSSSEAVVLAADALIGNIAFAEARTLASDLGSAVEEVAVQSRELRFGGQDVRIEGLFDLMAGARAGAAELREVGLLGLDLGSVAEADLARITKSLKMKDYGRAEAAALHLAERLKRGTPSFGSKGGGAPGVESGSGSGSGGQGSPSSEPASEAPSEFEKLAQEVDALAQESAAELSELERLLRDAQEAARADFEPSSELDEAIDELRDALDRLPENASGPEGPRSEAASARGHGEAMAEALDARDLLEGIERGADAADSLRRAQKMLAEQPGWMDRESLDRAQAALEKALDEARRAADALAQQQGQEIADSLKERSARQRAFSERAKDLAKRATDPDAPLPGKSIESLERASRLLEQAAKEMDAQRAEKGAELAAEAQTELERALLQGEESSESSDSGHEGGSGDPAMAGSVPDEERDRARRFRERVEKGLGRGSGHLSPAVRRYAEELK